MSGHEQAYVDEAFRTNWLSSVGPNIDAFEQQIAERLGEGVSALAVSSGTAALHLVLRHLGVRSGDRVAVSTLTFAGSVFPIRYLGAEPVLIDSERVSGNIDAALVAEYLAGAAARNELPRALIAVHLFGQHCDIDAIVAACDRWGVPVVEDAAESLGATYHGKQTATSAAFSILSFNGNKIITTTGGGMVISRDELALRRIKKWATQSREAGVEYIHTELGYNYRMSNVLAGIGRAQLSVLDDRVAARQRVAHRYREAFAAIPGLTLQPEASWGTHTRWLTVIDIDPKIHDIGPRDLMRALDGHNIEARPVWKPMHTQPLFADCERVGGSVAESLYEQGLCLPSSSSLTEADQDRVIAAVQEHVHESMLLSEMRRRPPTHQDVKNLVARGAASGLNASLGAEAAL